MSPPFPAGSETQIPVRVLASLVPVCETVQVFGLPLARLSTDDLVERILLWCQAPFDRSRVVFTPNSDHVVRLRRHPDLLGIYRRADLLVADGMPLVWTSRLLGKPIPERTTGTDLLDRLAPRLAGMRMFVLGGTDGVAERYARTLEQSGATTTVRAAHGFFDDDDPVVREIRDFRPDVLAVGLGSPAQERWIDRQRDRLGAKVIVAVGGAIEVLAGLRPRAPRWMQRAGFEWAWRLFLDPQRLWKRYLVDDLPILWLAAKEAWRQREAGDRVL